NLARFSPHAVKSALHRARESLSHPSARVEPLPRMTSTRGGTVARRDDSLRALARRQHGVFSLEQAIELGFGRSTISRWLERGVWEAVAPRVYRSAVARPVDWRQATMATTLA